MQGFETFDWKWKSQAIHFGAQIAKILNFIFKIKKVQLSNHFVGISIFSVKILFFSKTNLKIFFKIYDFRPPKLFSSKSTILGLPFFFCKSSIMALKFS